MLTMKINEDNMQFFRGEQLMLTVEETELDGGRIVIMAFKGVLHSEAADHIRDEIDACSSVGVKVILDFQEVTYVGASFLKALLTSQQNADIFRQGELLLRNIPDAVYEEMDKTGITELLKID